MVVCPCVIALRQTGDLSRVYPASRPMTARIGPSAPRDPEKEDGCVEEQLTAL